MPSSKSFQQTEDIQQIDIIHFNTTICILNTNTLIQFSVSAPDTTAPCEWLFLYPKLLKDPNRFNRVMYKENLYQMDSQTHGTSY